MEEQNKKNELDSSNNSDKQGNKVSRREVIRSIATLPVFGAIAYGAIKKNMMGIENRSILTHLGMAGDEQAEFFKNQALSPVKGDVIRIGIIGSGSRGMGLLREAGFITSDDLAGRKKDDGVNLKSWLKTESLKVELIGVCEVFDERAEAAIDASTNSRESAANSTKAPKAKRYKTYQELLASKEIDAVIIATPDHQHAQMTIDAVNAGKHVYCEKCMVRTEEEIYQVVDAVKKSGMVYQLGHQSRHSPVYAKAKELISKNILGQISLIETTTNRNTKKGAWIRHINPDGSLKPGNSKTIDWKQWLGNSPYVPFSIERYYNWTLWFAYGNGLWGQLLSHAFDGINGVTGYGIPKTCIASGGVYFYKDGREIPDVFQAVYEYSEKGTTFMYSATLSNSRNRGTVLMGHDASMELGGSLKVTADPDSKRYQKEIKSGLMDTSKPFVSVSSGGKNIDAVTSATSKYYRDLGLINAVVNGVEYDLTYLHLKDWLNVIRNGGDTNCNIDRGLEEAVTICMATKSYKEKRMVEWDPIKRKIV